MLTHVMPELCLKLLAGGCQPVGTLLQLFAAGHLHQHCICLELLMENEFVTFSGLHRLEKLEYSIQ